MRSLLSIMIAALSLSLGCVSTGKYETAVQERDQLANEHTKLQAEHAALRDKQTSLEIELAKMEIERKDLEGELRTLQNEYQSTQESLEAEKLRLGSEIEALEKEKGRLERNIQGMESDMQGLTQELEKQREEAAQLKSTYDGLVSNLQSELAAGQIEIRQLRDGLSVDVAQDILFASGSAELDREGRNVLLKVSEQLKETPYQIVVGGHTDNVQIGPRLVDRYPTNWELAGARSASVVRLFEEAGIEGTRLLAASYGEYAPRDTNETPEGRQRNRRIEIRLKPVVPDEEG